MFETITRAVVGHMICSLRSIILSGLRDSKVVIGPRLCSLRSRIAPRAIRDTFSNSEQQESKMQVHPRQLGTDLLGHQILTRNVIDRSIVIDDVYGKRRLMPGLRIINNMAELRAVVVQYKLEDLIQKIDVQQGCVSLDDASAMWLYLQAEGATFLLKRDSVLASLVWKASFIQYDLNSVGQHLVRAQSIVEELGHSKEALAARLNGAEII